MDDRVEKEYINLEERLGFYLGRIISHPLIPPEHVYFSLTNRCNLRCQMCSISKSPSRAEDELTTDKAKDIIVQVKDMGIKHLIFSGGEPLLRDDLLALVEFAVQNNIKMVDIITNGTLFTDDFIQKLIKIKLNHITVSLDGLGRVNDEIRAEGVFEKTKNTIDKLNDYKSKNNTLLPTVGINFTIMNKNIYDILPMIDFARDKKCNIIVFQPVLFNNANMCQKKKNSLWIPNDKIYALEKIIKQIINLKDAPGDTKIYTDNTILESIPEYFRGKRLTGTFKCYEAIKRLVITCDGKIWSCVGIMGDIKKEDLKTIWFSKIAKKMRDRVKKCSKHCLQDCVYFPYDVLQDVRGLLKNLKHLLGKNEECIRSVLLKKIEYYINILSAQCKPHYLNIRKNTNFKNEINKFLLIKKEIADLYK